MKIKDKIITARSRSERKKKKATHQTGRYKSLVMGKKEFDFKHFGRTEEKKCDTEKSNKQSKRF